MDSWLASKDRLPKINDYCTGIQESWSRWCALRSRVHSCSNITQQMS